MSALRKPTLDELNLLSHLVRKANLKIEENWINYLVVRGMDDGGMGSLTLFPFGKIEEHRKFGEQVSDFQFKDADGVDVIASLYLDENGSLFELDMWKVDFSAVIRLPNSIDAT